MYKHSGINFVILFEVLFCLISCLKFHLLSFFFFVGKDLFLLFKLDLCVPWRQSMKLWTWYIQNKKVNVPNVIFSSPFLSFVRHPSDFQGLAHSLQRVAVGSSVDCGLEHTRSQSHLDTVLNDLWTLVLP